MPTTLTARDVMTSEVKTADADWTVRDLADFLMSHAISGAPVVSAQGRLLGVVSVTDLVRHESLPAHARRPEPSHDVYMDDLERDYQDDEFSGFRIDHEDETLVSDIMTPMVFEVHPETDIRQIADTMIRGRIHRVFVTENKHVVGVISALDLLRVIRDQ